MRFTQACRRRGAGAHGAGKMPAIPGGCSRAGGGRSPPRLAWSATPIRRRRTSTTVRGSVGASPSRSDYGDSTVRWKCSPKSISERIVAIPQVRPWLTPSHPPSIVIVGLDPRNQACVYREQFSCSASERVSRGDAPGRSEWIPALCAESHLNLSRTSPEN